MTPTPPALKHICSERVPLIAWVIIIVLASFCILCIMQMEETTGRLNKLQGDAVRYGYAEWKVDARTGGPEWFWILPEKERKP